MKPVLSITLLIITALVLTFPSCQKAERAGEAWHLTGADSAIVVKEVLAAGDAWAEANVKMDAEKSAGFFDSSQQMMLAENGFQYANWDSLHAFMKAWYAQPLDSVECRWEERSVLALSKRAADVFGRLYFRAKFKSGAIYESRPIETWLWIKEDGSWKIMRGHESYKILGNK
jgi:hypothetical protein